MARPSPLILLMVLLGAVWFVAAQPLVRVIALVGILLILIAIFSHLLIRAGRRSLLWALAGVVALTAIAGVAITRPALRHTYVPDQLAHAPELAEYRGFYPSEQDTAGNRYAWTQNRATLLLNFLVNKPINLIVEMRSAAVAGGPDAPVHVAANGVDVGQLHPDPTNANFQSLSLRFVPFDWGGEQTEIKLLPDTFQPGKSDTRMLGVMVKSITIDKTEAWSSVSQRMWLFWILPLLAVVSAGLLWMMRRRPSPLLGYGAIALCALGAGCAAFFLILLQRVKVVDFTTYRVWSLSASYFVIGFALAAITIPFGRADAPSGWQYTRQWLARRRFVQRALSVRQRKGLAVPATVTDAERRRGVARDLAFVFLIAFSVRIIWALLIPPWLAPDEPDHYIYVSHIVEVGQVPHPPDPHYPYYPLEQLHSGGLTLDGQLSTGISGSESRELPYFPINYDYKTARDYTAPTKDRLSSAGARATGYPAFYYLAASLPYKLLQGAPIISRLFAVRLTSALFGALSCLFGYLFAFEIRRERRWGWALGMCMALLPMYAFDTSVANNDSLMIMFATALIWLVTRAWLRPEIRPSLAFAIGATTGFMLFAKPTGIILAPIAGAIMLVKAWPLLRTTWRRIQPRIVALGAYVAGLAVGYGPWLVFRIHYYRDTGIGIPSFAPIFRFVTGIFPFTRGLVSTTSSVPASASPPAVTHSFSAYLKYEQHQGWTYFHWLFVKTFWGYFGWLDTPLSEGVYRVITIVCIIGLIGLALQFVLQSRRRALLVLVLGIVIAQSLTLFLLPDYYVNFRSTGAPVGLQGRYFFPVIAPILFLLLSGWNHLLGERPFATRIAPFAMLLMQGIGLSTILIAYYGVTIG